MNVDFFFLLILQYGLETFAGIVSATVENKQ